MRVLFAIAIPILCAAVAVAQENGPRGHLALDAPAPELVALRLDGKPATLAGLRGANPDKVIVLQFASMTDPIFRAHVPTVEKVAAKEAGKAVFVIVYQKEAHPASDPLVINTSAGFNLPAPQTLAAREKMAQQAVDQLHIASESMLVDSWDNTSSTRYGSLPNMTFLIDAKGTLRAAYPFMDPAKVEAAVEMLASGKPLPEQLRGSIQSNGPAPFDVSGAAMDMTGGRGPASIAAVLERATLTDQQKLALLTGIAEFMADVQEFRQVRAALPAAPARAGAAATNRGGATGGGVATAPAGTAPVAGGGGAGGGAATKPITPADVLAAQITLRSAADHLKVVVRQNLNAHDAAALFAALDTMAPAQQLFANP